VIITGSGALGRSLSGSNDLDGDGADDLLVGAPATSTGSLFFLPYDSIISDLVVPGAESASWHGSWPGDGAGFSFSGLGDFDEDGTAEFAIAAPKSDTAASDAGQVWILPAY
jgi:glycosylphosphatidylinositol phospholipase D